jgi:small GTP-binding protein
VCLGGSFISVVQSLMHRRQQQYPRSLSGGSLSSAPPSWAWFVPNRAKSMLGMGSFVDDNRHLERKLAKIEIKVVTMGTCGAGKSTFVGTLKSKCNSFAGIQPSTIGAQYQALPIPGYEDTHTFHLWDTAGQERFRTLIPMYTRNARVVFLFVDVSDRASWHELTTYWNGVANAIPGVSKALIANKTDILNRQVTSTELEAFAQKSNMCLVECCALKHESVQSAIDKIVSKLPIEDMQPQGGGDLQGVVYLGNHEKNNQQHGSSWLPGWLPSPDSCTIS